MELSTSMIFLGLIFGSIGMGYFIYGKRQSHIVARYTGLALMFLPYFVTQTRYMTLAGIALMAVPIFVKDL